MLRFLYKPHDASKLSEGDNTECSIRVSGEQTLWTGGIGMWYDTLQMRMLGAVGIRYSQRRQDRDQ